MLTTCKFLQNQTKKEGTQMKTRNWIALLLALCLLVFAGCGKKNEEENGPIVLEAEGISAENVSPYDGVYLENGEEEQVSGVCAMAFTNTSDKTIQEADLVFFDGVKELSFHLEMLAAGQTVTVAEAEKQTAEAEQLQYADGKVTYLEDGLENPDSVEVTTVSDGVVSIRNTTEEDLPLVRVFYRNTDGSGNALGGICYSCIADGIPAGEAVEVEAENWTETSTVATVLVVWE